MTSIAPAPPGAIRPTARAAEAPCTARRRSKRLRGSHGRVGDARPESAATGLDPSKSGATGAVAEGHGEVVAEFVRIRRAQSGPPNDFGYVRAAARSATRRD